MTAGPEDASPRDSPEPTIIKPLSEVAQLPEVLSVIGFLCVAMFMLVWCCSVVKMRMFWGHDVKWGACVQCLGVL